MNKNKSLSSENLITIKELAEIKNVSTDLINKKVKLLFPDITKNGKTTYLNELHCTEIIKSIDVNPHLLQSSKVETKQQEDDLIKRGYALLLERELNYKQQIENQAKQIEQAKPAVEFYENYSDVKNNMSFRTASSYFGVGRNKFIKFLKEEKIVDSERVAYRQFQEHEYFVIKMKHTGNGYNTPVSLITPRGFKWLDKKYFQKAGIKNYIAGINK